MPTFSVSFLEEGSPKIDYRKRVPFFLSSLLEDLAVGVLVHYVLRRAARLILLQVNQPEAMNNHIYIYI